MLYNLPTVAIDYYKIKSQDAKFLSRLCKYSLTLMLFTYLPFLTFILFYVAYFAGRRLFNIYYLKLYSNGLIQVLPLKIKDLLLAKTLFDLLCDIWYNSQLSVYIRTFLKPLIQNIQPENAMEILDELPSSAKKMLCTKGLINLMPSQVQKALLPSTAAESEVKEKLEDDFQSERINSDYKKFSKKKIKKLRSFEEDNIDLISERSFIKSPMIPWSTSRRPNAFQIQMQKKKQLIHKFFIQSSQEEQKQSSENGIILINEEIDQLPKTIVLKKSIPLQSKRDLSEQNDQLVPNQKIEIKFENFSNRLKSMEGPFKTIYQYIQLAQGIRKIQKSGKKLQDIEQRRLVHFFLFSTSILLIQTIISKKARRFFIKSSLAMFYVGCATFSSGTLALIMFKIIKNKEKQKRIKKEFDQ